MSDTDQKSWIYTAISELAQAARAHQAPYLRDQTIRVCEKAMEQYNAERAVIEAARRVTKARSVMEYAMATEDDVDCLRYAERDLDEAVEALEPDAKKSPAMPEGTTGVE